MGQVDDAPQLRKEIARLQDRVATLEKLAVDPARNLSDEIEKLRAIPSTTRTPDHAPRHPDN
jgi:hypothetical protein